MRADPVERYLAQLPELRAARGRAMHALVLKLFPNAAVSFDYRMPTYRIGDNFFAWASQKQYLSVYTCSSERIAAFVKKYPQIKSGVGCINFRDNDAFVIAHLSAVVKAALKPGASLVAREQAARTQCRR